MKKKISILLSVVCFFGLFSCGIRPINRPDHNIVGVDTSYAKESEPVNSEPQESDTEKPIIDFVTSSPESYVYEYTPGMTNKDSLGNPVFTYLTDEEYIREHTLGYFYIQNKGTGLYMSSYGIYLEELGYEYVFGDYYLSQILRDYAYAMVYQMIELTNGYYAFITPNRYSADYYNRYYVRKAMSSSGNSVGGGGFSSNFPKPTYLWQQSYVIKKTESGAYTMTTRFMDMTGGCHLSYRTKHEDRTNANGEYDVTITYLQPYFAGKYTDDDDYSDEWLFIPAEPPETEAP